MADKPSKKPAGLTKAPRKPYAAPRLTCYGEVRNLTTGGTGTAAETITPLPPTNPKPRP